MACDLLCKMSASRKVAVLRIVLGILSCLNEVWLSRADENPTPVLLVVFDGFGWDFLSEADTPHFDNLIHNGVTVPFVWNVFPTSSLPNHYTLATGLYPSIHGILDNNIYDSKLNASFTMRTIDSVWFNNAGPIWVTNQKHGFKSGNCFWPGYNVNTNISGYYPSLSTRNSGFEPPFDPVNASNVMPFKERIDLVVHWLTLPDPPTFDVVYFEELDEVSHKFGPHSNETKQEIIKADNITGYLMSRLKENELHDKISLIITADHGQVAYNSSVFINFDRYVPPELYDFWPMGASSITPMIAPKPGKNFTEVVEKFRKAAIKESGKMQIFEKSEIPYNLHFKYENRIGDALIIMEAPWKFNTSKIAYNRNHTMLPNVTRGTLQYLLHNTSCKGMRPFFIAHGPSFKQGYRGRPIHSVDIYPLICHLLGIQPAPNNGSLYRVCELFRESAKPEPVLSLTRTIVDAQSMLLYAVEKIGYMP